MIRKHKIRALEINGKKRSAFRIRKQPVDPEKINRYIREHPAGANDDRKIGGNIGSAGMLPAALVLA